MTPASHDLNCEPTAPAHARRWTAQRLRELLPPATPSSSELIEDAVLCVSELVSNAIRAGCTMLTLRLSCDTSTVRLSLIDDAPGQPVPRRAGPDDIAGRGLHIVEAVARRWGFSPIARGKEVWVEFACVA